MSKQQSQNLHKMRYVSKFLKELDKKKSMNSNEREIFDESHMMVWSLKGIFEDLINTNTNDGNVTSNVSPDGFNMKFKWRGKTFTMRCLVEDDENEYGISEHLLSHIRNS
ncbi:hypothetical protein OAR00_00330 [Alphaproteobacteria bacterium]|nr:hypothetical protein [Alphaproteobacteria bacterium]